MDHNEWLRRRKQHKQGLDPLRLFEAIRKGERRALAEGITLVESDRSEDKIKAADLIERCLPFSGNSLRVGITGVPGVGKSTFIESFGSLLVENGKKVAVLAVDPTSSISKGSILGDKTRMESLSMSEQVFIRPSAAGDSLGGVARKTRESIILCEAAGYNFILIETVGVGQSETVVKSMVDFFLLLMLSGAGDELQGIKKGIMEMADGLLITKAEGENLLKAKQAAAQYKNALHLFQGNPNGWIVETGICSALERTGLDEVFNWLDRYERKMTANGWLAENRKNQLADWFKTELNEAILASFYENTEVKATIEKLKEQVLNQSKSPYRAAEELFATTQIKK